MVHRSLFNQLKSKLYYDYYKLDKNEYIFGEESGAIENCPGILLASIGSYSHDTTKEFLDYSFVRQLNSAYHTGHCRKRCHKVGLATYRTVRGTNRVHPRPTVAENEVGQHQYYSHMNNRSHLVQFETEMIANQLGQSALKFGTREHYPLFKHIADTCDMTIVTSGVPSSTQIAEFAKKLNKNTNE